VLDFTSKVLTLFKADTSDLKAGLRDLQGEEKKLAQAQLDAANQRNKGYDDWVKKLGDVNQALELGIKAVGFAKDAFKSYSDDLRLRAAAGSVSIDKLKTASLGLRTEHDLLTFAAQTQHGAFKLTEQQMITAQKAMVALTRAGFDQEEVTKKVTDALVKANGGGLDDFGILLKSGKTDLENFNNLMDALAQKAAGVDESTSTAGEGVSRMGVSMSDSMDKMKQAIGSLVVSLEPLLSALADAVAFAAKLIDLLPRGASGQDINTAQKVLAGGGSLDDVIAGLNKRDQQVAAAAGASAPKLLRARDYWDDDTEGSRVDDAGFYTWSNGVIANIPDPKKKGSADGASRFGAYASVTGTDTAGAPLGFGSTMYADAIGLGRDQSVLRDEIGRDAEGSALADASKQIREAHLKFLAEQDAMRLQLEQHQAAYQQSFLESAFGKLEDFNLYAEAFQMLSGSVTSAMDAWISGSVSAGAAIKKFLADAIAGVAKQMAVEGLKHAAYGIGSLAFGDLRGAASHGAAAAAFGAGAAAAAVTAKALGGGASQPAASGTAAGAAGGGAGASRGSAGSGGGGGGGQQVIRERTVIYTDAFAMGSPSYKNEIARRAIAKATGGTSWQDD
jgi:hypothetical protein